MNFKYKTTFNKDVDYSIRGGEAICPAWQRGMCAWFFYSYLIPDGAALSMIFGSASAGEPKNKCRQR